MNWKIIDFNKIPGETPFNTYFDTLNRYQFNHIVNYNKDVFFLLGDDSGENPDYPNAIIYGSTDFGNTFHKTTLGKGSIKEGVFIDKNLLVVLEKNEFIEGLKKTTCTLFLSRNLGETWSEIKTFEGESIENLNFYSENIGIASFYKPSITGDGLQEYRYTINGGRTWKRFDIDNPDFEIATNCWFQKDNILWFISKNNLMSYDLTSDNLKIEKKLPVPIGMIAQNIYKDEKSGERYTFFGYDDEKENDGEIYYLESDRHVILKNGFGNVYGEVLYKFNYETPYSNYEWSEDWGKTWHKEKIEDFFPVPRPIGYSGKGYIYMLATLFKGKQEDRGARLVIGYPGNK